MYCFKLGNIKNMERVWLAEEKHKEELRRQKEMKEKREEEIKISELRRQLHEQEALKSKEYEMLERPKSKYGAKGQISQLRSSDAAGLIVACEKGITCTFNAPSDKPITSSKYKEDTFKNGHSSVYGSLYDKETDCWGYRCCGQYDKSSKCLKAVENGKDDDDNNRKRYKRHRSSPIKCDKVVKYNKLGMGIADVLKHLDNDND